MRACVNGQRSKENDKCDAHDNYGGGRGNHDPSKMMTKESVFMLLCHAVSSALELSSAAAIKQTA